MSDDWGIVGHGAVVALLRDEAARPTHAYLFVGPANVGKATVARRFAAELLCPPGADGDDCRRRVVGGVHPDLTLVEPEGRTALTVEQARATVSHASLAPVESDHKVFLFEEAGLMNDEAANALLKTLEEPTATTIFVLLVESEHDLPATIASRCRSVHFGRVRSDDIVAALLHLGLDEDRAADVARISGGRPGLALALATRPEVVAFRQAWLAVPLQVTEQPGDAYRLAAGVVAASEPLLEALRARQQEELDAAARHGTDTKALKDRHERELRRSTRALFVTGLEILASWYRDAAAAQLGAPVRNPDVPAPALTTVEPEAAVARATLVLDAVDALQANQRPELAFASLFADLGAPWGSE